MRLHPRLGYTTPVKQMQNRSVGCIMAEHILCLNPDQPASYRITVQGRLDARWADNFSGMQISTSPTDCPPSTTLVGIVTDQAALHGLLLTLHNLGLPLLAVACIAQEHTP